MNTGSSVRNFRTAGRPNSRTTGCRAVLYGSTRSRMKPLKYTLKAKFMNTGRIPITTSLTTTTTPYWQFRTTCMFLVTAVKAFLLCVCGRQKLQALI